MNIKSLTILSVISVGLFSNTASGAGFHLREQSAAAQGNAYAGSSSAAENNTFAYYNPASLTRMKGLQISAGGTYIAPRASAKNIRYADGRRDADVENVVHAAISPNITVSYQVNDKLFLALAGNSPFGMITKYDREWAGSDHGVTSDVKTATFTPMAAYKLNDKLSLGAGLQVQYVWAHLTNSNRRYGVAGISSDGDALDLGYQLGAMYEFTDNTRVGIGYRSEVKHKIKGEMKADDNMVPGMQGVFLNNLMNQDISVRLNTPAMLSMGVYHDVNEKWAVMAEYQRVFWSSLQNLTFVGKELNRPDAPYITRIKENWRDTNFYAVGTSYKLDEQWKVRFGLAYDQSAVRFAHRTPRIPDTDRIWFSAGLGYDYNEHLSFDVGATYIKAHSAHLETAVTGNEGVHATADYDNSIKVFAFGMTYKF